MRTTNFTAIGQQFTVNKTDQWDAQFQRMAWESVPCKLPMMQGEGIKAMVKQLKLPAPVKVAWSATHPAQDGYALLATEHQTKKQHFQVFAVDTGDSLTPIAMVELQ